jgi:hypothetical protein
VWVVHCIIKQHENEIKIRRNRQHGVWVACRIIKQHQKEIKIKRNRQRGM